MSFTELQGTFERAADVVGAGAHSEIEGDGIQTIDKRFWKPNKDGTSFWFHDERKYLGTQNRMWRSGSDGVLFNPILKAHVEMGSRIVLKIGYAKDEGIEHQEHAKHDRRSNSNPFFHSS